MDHARSFDFVQQLPRKTITDVHTSDTTYAHQVLLNESWADYCKRRKQPKRAAEVHEKWITETWDEFLARAVLRANSLAQFDAAQDAIIAENETADERRREVGRTVVEAMMAAEAQRVATTRLPHSLTLLLDFDELRQQRFRRERLAVETEETAKRLWLVDEASTERAAMLRDFEQTRAQMAAAAEAARLAAEAERKRREDELRRAEEARKAAEEAERRAVLDAERRRRADDEEAKRIERKRKEDERRAKAKSEREARTKAVGGAASSMRAGERPEDANPGRVARVKRMHDALPAATEQIRALVATCDSVEGFCGKVADLLGNGSLLFHTAVYFGIVSPKGDSVQYVAASANCSEKLRSCTASIAVKDSSNLAAMAKSPKALPHIGPMPCAQQDVVQIGSGPWPPVSGEACFFPICDAKGNLWGVLAADTASNNALDPRASFQLPDEEGCYQVADAVTAEPRERGGADSDKACAEPVAITPEVVAFLDDVAAIAATAAATLPSRHAKAFDFDVDLLRGIPSLGQLLATFTHLIRKALSTEQRPVECYVSALTAGAAGKKAALVVAHNGRSIASSASVAAKEIAAGTPQHLVGGRIENAAAKTFSLPTAAMSMAFVADVSADASCVAFDTALPASLAQKPSESLLLIPIALPLSASSVAGGDAAAAADSSNGADVLWGAVGISGIAEAFAAPLADLVWNSIRGLIISAMRRAALLSACGQAIEWLTVATGHSNVYIALTHARGLTSAEQIGSAPLEIVRASEAQQFLEGKTWSPADGGISHQFAANCVGHTQVSTRTAKHFATLKDDTDETTRKIKFWNGALKDSDDAERGQLLMCAIAQNKPDAKVHGILYVDTLKVSSRQLKAETITASDTDVFHLTAQLLAATLDGEASMATDGSAARLAIEEEHGKTDVAFLTRLFDHATRQVRGITNGQLQELARYPAPPPVIPTTVAAAVILLGSSKASTVWDDLRKKIKQPLLDAIGKFDPTDAAVKKKCVIKAKSLTKNLTANDVFTKGSHPASCLFTWVFICLLLRKFAKVMRERSANEKDRIEALLGVGGGAVGDEAVDGGADDGDDGDDGAALEAGGDDQ